MAPDSLLIQRVIEAALLASPQPLSVTRLVTVFDESPALVGKSDVVQALSALKAQCDGRGIELVEVASGWRYQVRTELHPWVTQLLGERRTRYSRATLETLALIAYRQPITRGEIEQVRGVAVSSQIIQTLEDRDWIHVVGHREVAGRPALFGTTQTFLDHFGLRRLEELPPLAKLIDSLDGTPVAVPAAISPADDHTRTTLFAPLDGAPDAAPGTRAAENNESEFNAVAMTTVAVDQADSETQGRPLLAGRSPTDE